MKEMQVLSLAVSYSEVIIALENGLYTRGGLSWNIKDITVGLDSLINWSAK